jgi:hypothetical protein
MRLDKAQWLRATSCSTQRAHEILNAAPAPKNRGPAASGSARESVREASLSEETGVAESGLSDLLSINQRAYGQVPKWEAVSRFGKSPRFS